MQSNLKSTEAFIGSEQVFELSDWEEMMFAARFVTATSTPAERAMLSSVGLIQMTAMNADVFAATVGSEREGAIRLGS